MRLLFTLLLALPLWAAPAPFLPKKPDNAEAGLKALQGEWVEVACNHDGKDMRMEGESLISFAGNQHTVRMFGFVRSRWRATVDPSMSPGLLTLVREPPDEYAGMVLRCRFRLDGDTLTTAYRPLRLLAPPPGLESGKGVIIEVYKRKRP
jgi:uncharacterized protein (TIGR03067 family)